MARLFAGSIIVALLLRSPPNPDALDAVSWLAFFAFGSHWAISGAYRVLWSVR